MISGIWRTTPFGTSVRRIISAIVDKKYNRRGSYAGCGGQHCRWIQHKLKLWAVHNFTDSNTLPYHCTIANFPRWRIPESIFFSSCERYRLSLGFGFLGNFFFSFLVLSVSVLATIMIGRGCGTNCQLFKPSTIISTFSAHLTNTMLIANWDIYFTMTVNCVIREVLRLTYWLS